MRRWMCWSLVLLLLVPLCPLQAENTLQQRVREGQDALYRLNYAKAEAIFQQMARDEPNNPVGHGLLAVTAWNQLLFAAKNLALDDYGTPTPFSRKPTKPIEQPRRDFLEANIRLLNLCERLLEANPENLMALYFKGLAYENLAGEAIAISKDTSGATRNGKTARKIHQEVLKRDPSIVDANTSVAVSEFAAATLPWSIKWLAFLLGVRGDKQRALKRLEEVSERGTYRNLDAEVLLALLNTWKGDPRQAESIFQKLRERYPQNYLLDFNLAAVYELRLKEPKSALRVYQELLRSLGVKAPGLHPGEVHYRIGKTYVTLLDYSQALQAFSAALQSTNGERETRPLAYFYMARIHQHQGDHGQARKYYQQVLASADPDANLEDEKEEAGRVLRGLGPVKK